ncbi:MAG: hypothetical protein IT428_16820 [Planctomycetaceae bacterium]|nr:hypothetical protein [Planctomycetaceae bacterium]
MVTVPLLDRAARKEVNSNKRIPLLETALFKPFPYADLIADYYVRSYILPAYSFECDCGRKHRVHYFAAGEFFPCECGKKTELSLTRHLKRLEAETGRDDEPAHRLWDRLSRSRLPIQETVARFVDQEFPNLDRPAKNKQKERWQSVAETLTLNRDFVVAFESVNVNPELFKKAMTNEEILKYFDTFYAKLLDEGKTPSEATLVANIRARGQYDRARGVSERSIYDNPKTDPPMWADALVRQDSIMRLHALFGKDDEKNTRLPDGSESPLEIRRQYFMVRMTVLPEATAAIALKENIRVDLTQGQPFSEGERQRMDTLGRIVNFRDVGPPTPEEIRLAILREFAAGSRSQLVDAHTVSRPLTMPFHPALNDVLRKHDARMLHYVHDVSDVTGPDGSGTPRRDSAILFTCGYSVRQGIGMSEPMKKFFDDLNRESPLHADLTRLLQFTMKHGPETQRSSDAFELTASGWRCPSLRDRIAKNEAPYRIIEEMQRKLFSN